MSETVTNEFADAEVAAQNVGIMRLQIPVGRAKQLFMTVCDNDPGGGQESAHLFDLGEASRSPGGALVAVPGAAV